MFFQLTDKDQFADNQFNKMIDTVLSNPIFSVAVIKFKGHVCFVQKNSDSDFFILRQEFENDDENYIKVIDPVNEINVDCYKYITHTIIQFFKKQYSEYEHINFPIEQMEFGFFENIDLIAYR